MPSNPGKVEHLYVHVPFCVTKCEYCAFYSRPGTPDQMTAYVDAVLLELQEWQSRSSLCPLLPSTIFFGGGTPTLLPVPQLNRLLAAVGAFGTPVEWTVEANPATVTRAKADALRAAGVNRVSLGVQTFEPVLLERLGRIHTAAQAEATFRLLRAAGFDNLNLDLMFGLPGQTIATLRKTLRRAIAWQPEHLSAYCLILEEDTKFWRLYCGTGVSPVSAVQAEERAGRSFSDKLPSDDEQLAMYELVIEQLTGAGYRHYEVSNFAKPGRECRHNIACWEGKDYLGLGPSACSTIGLRRWQNVPDTAQYVEAMSSVGRAVPARRVAVSFEENLTEATKQGERVAFGLRMLDGVPAALVCGRWDTEIAELLANGLVQWRADRLQVTPRGLRFADEVAAEFV